MSVDDALFDAQERLSAEWKKSFPNGKLPDRIGYLLSQVRKEYFVLLIQTNRSKEKE